MARNNSTTVFGGLAILGIAGSLAAFAAKQAKEADLQEEIAARLVHLPGVDSAYVEVARAWLPGRPTRVTGGVCLVGEGIDEIEGLFDSCVHAVRDVMDTHGDVTAEIDLRAEPVEAAPMPGAAAAQDFANA